MSKFQTLEAGKDGLMADPPYKPGLPEVSPDRESFLDVVPFYDKWKDFQRFLDTREAVLAGEPLHLLSKNDLKDRNLMGPWKFNVLQSVISSAPALLVVQVVKHYRHFPEASLFPTLVCYDRIFHSLEVLIIPFTLLITVVVIGFTYRPPEFETDVETKRRRQDLGRHYLYLDASYGLAPQCICAIYSAAASVGLPGIVLAWQLVITFRRIPGDLYSPGVSLDQPIGLLNPKQPASVPWLRYTLAVLIFVPVLTVLIYLLLVLFSYLVAVLMQSAVG